MQNAEIVPGEQFNLLSGVNGAGKTTLLEAIYILARNKTFRSTETKNLIQRDKEAFLLFAEAAGAEGAKRKIGIRRSKNESEIRIDGKRVRKRSQIAKALPLGVITPNTHRLIEEGPHHRRRFLNWGMFHVEPAFSEIAHSYSRALQQRNRAIRQEVENIDIWDTQLAKLGEEISSQQQNYIDEWREISVPLFKQYMSESVPEIVFKRGWTEKKPLFEELKRKRANDKKQGHTSVGPHRCDIKFAHNGRDVRETMSRGQQKLFTTIMVVGQILALENRVRERPVVLLDDLTSEFDRQRQIEVIDLLRQTKAQCFITAIDVAAKELFEDGELEMFHVEQGEVKNITMR